MQAFFKGVTALARTDPFHFLSVRRSGWFLRLRVQCHSGAEILALQIRKQFSCLGCCCSPGSVLGWDGIGFADCCVAGVFWRLEEAAALERFGRKCCRACEIFCAIVKRSANPSMAGLNSPLGETGKSRKAILSASLISVKFSHRWRFSTTRLAMVLPIACTIPLVAKSVAVHSSLKASGQTHP